MLTLQNFCHQKNIITPEELIRHLPCSLEQNDFIKQSRLNACNIIKGNDSRLLIIIGPCSIHDEEAAFEYATHLKAASEKFSDDLFIIMRNYFQKPRTTLGWKGLISDPFLNNTYDVNHGLWLARKILSDLNTLKVPCATEFVDPVTSHYLSDFISWSSIGARTVESQLHREFASGLTMPVGFKNNTDGNIKVAMDAIITANEPHHYISLNTDGMLVVLATSGNQNCHIVLRGSNTMTNYQNLHVKNALIQLKKKGLNPYVMIDCSHGNSMRDHRRQYDAINDVALQLTQDTKVFIGLMIESHLIAGKQLFNSKENLVYGQSITDSCIGWNETLKQLEKLALAVRRRRN